MADTPTFGRYAEIPYDQMTPEQQEGYRTLIETRGRLPGPNKIYVHNPKLAKDDKVEAILSGLPTSFSDKREQVVYEMGICLSNSRWVAKGLYDRAVEALGHEGITDVITLMGFYTSVSMTLAFYDVPAGAEGLQR